MFDWFRKKPEPEPKPRPKKLVATGRDAMELKKLFDDMTEAYEEKSRGQVERMLLWQRIEEMFPQVTGDAYWTIDPRTNATKVYIWQPIDEEA